MAQKVAFFAPFTEISEVNPSNTPKKTEVFFECFSLCLSRACLGKMFVFTFKWHLKKTVFRQINEVKSVSSNATRRFVVGAYLLGAFFPEKNAFVQPAFEC
jgi:hypothetical protein